MQLAISNIAFDAAQDDEVFEIMKSNGYSGLEIAPTRLFQNPYDDLSRIEKYADTLWRRHGFTVCSMQSIWYGKSESIYDVDGGKVLLDYTKKAIDFSAAGGIKNLVFGCPKNRNIPVEIDRDVAESIAEKFLFSLGEYALKRGTVLSLEPNPDIYGTNYIDTTEQAFETVKRISSGGLKVNIDLGTMIHNGESPEILRGHLEFINHVHLSRPYLEYVIPDEIHERLRLTLDSIGYDRFLSIEMKKVEDISLLSDCLKYVGGFFVA